MNCFFFSCYCKCNTTGKYWSRCLYAPILLQWENQAVKTVDFFKKQLTLLCNFYDSRNVLGNLTFDCDIRKGCGLSHCDFFSNLRMRSTKQHGFEKITAFYVSSCLYSLSEVYSSHCLKRASMVQLLCTRLHNFNHEGYGVCLLVYA